MNRVRRVPRIQCGFILSLLLLILGVPLLWCAESTPEAEVPSEEAPELTAPPEVDITRGIEGWDVNAGKKELPPAVGELPVGLKAATRKEPVLPGEAEEREALRLEGRDELLGAQSLLLLALDKATGAAKSQAAASPAEGGVARSLWAYSEFLLDRCWISARVSGLPQEFLALASRLASTPASLDAVFAARLAWVAGDLSWRTADTQSLERFMQPLALIRSWQVLGPFDNERGRGFSKRLTPEAWPFNPEVTDAGLVKEMTWRTVTSRDPRGILDLSALLQPNENTLAYAAVAVKSPIDRVAALRIGSDDSVAVWLNGGQVILFDGLRPLGLDQNAALVSLKQGWNFLLCKVGNGEKNWSLAARFTQPDGRPLEDLTFHHQLSDLREAVNALPPEVQAPAPVGALSEGATAYYLRRIKVDANDHRSSYRLGWLLLTRLTLGVRNQQAREVLLAAVKAAPSEGHYSLALSEAARDVAVSSPDRDENLRREVLEEALNVSDVTISARIGLAEYYLYTMNNLDRARRIAEEVESDNPLSLRTQLLLVDLYRILGWEAQSEVRLKALYRRNPSSAGVLLRSGNQAFQRGRLAEALTHFRRLHALDVTQDSGRNGILATALRLGDEALLEEALDTYLLLCPYDYAALLDLADLYLRSDRTEEAMALLDRALIEAPSQSDLLSKKGEILLLLDRREEAMRCFHQALELAPTLVSLRRYVDFLEERKDELISTIDDLRAFDEASRGVVVPAGTSRLFLLNEMASRINPDGTRSQLQHYVVRILNRDAANELSSIPITYESARESARVISARVLRRSGKLESARISQVAGRAEMDFKFIRFTPLEVGDVIDIAFRKDEFRQGFFGDYFGEVCYFHRDHPVVTSRYLLEIPRSRKFYLHSLGGAGEGVEISAPGAELRRLRWEMKDLPGLEEEPFMPSRQELSAQVQVSTFANWDELVNWYSHLIKDQLVLTPEIRRKVQLLTLGMESDTEKLEAIYRWVSTDIRNEAWQFGVHGYKPYSTDVIFRRRFGDCKDKSMLVNVMASELGLPAWPVLVRATDDQGPVLGRSREDLTLPILNHFNHCISAVKVGDMIFYMDPTIPYHALTRLPSQNLDASAVEVREEGAVLSRIPAGAAEGNGWSDETEMVLRPDGSAGIEQHGEVTGEVAAFFRTYLGRGQDVKVVEFLVSRLWGRATVQQAEIEATEDPLSDLVLLNTRIELEEACTLKEDTLLLTLPQEWIRGDGDSGAPLPGRLSSLAVASVRSYDLLLAESFSLTRKWHVALPAGYQVAFLPEPVELVHPFGKLTFQCSVADGMLTVTRSLALLQCRIPREEYDTFRAFCHRADEVDEIEFVLEKIP